MVFGIKNTERVGPVAPLEAGVLVIVTGSYPDSCFLAPDSG